MSENDFILTEATLEELEQAIQEVEWSSKYEISERSQAIILAALRNVRDAREMYGKEETADD